MFRLAIAVVLGMLLAAPARAQQPITRADTAAVLVAEAERLASGDADELAAALARLVQRRYGDTPAAARAAAVLAQLVETRPVGVSRAGRVGLISYTTLYGAWLGVAFPLMLESESPEAYGLGLLVGAPIGFFGGRAFAHGRSVTGGDAGVITWGGLWGTWQGGGWMNVLGGDEVCDPPEFGGGCYDSGPEASDIVGAMVAGGLIGTGVGMYAADRTDIGGGTATMISWASLWGTWGGVASAIVLDFEGEDEPLVAALLGGDAGLLAMALLAPRWDMSSGRAWLVNAGGVMGGTIGAGLDLIVQPSDEDVAILIPTIGAGIGLALGAHLTRDMDEGRVRRGMLDDDASPALVRVRDGEWSVSLPQPAPALLREHASDRGELGLRFELLDARFGS